VAAMADACLALLDDDARAHHMALAARRRAEHAFRPEAAVDRYLDVYRRALAG